MKIQFGIVAAVGGLFLASSALAENATGNASVTVQQALSFDETQQIVFGAISDADGSCIMGPTGTLSGQCAGQPSGTPGEFQVQGTENQLVTVSVSNGTTVDGVTLTPVLNSPSSVTLDSQGISLVSISGQLDLVQATGGTKALTYIVSVSYQ